MNAPRSSGILLHPTSLPGKFGIGDFGPDAHRFVEQLKTAGQKIWQILPLGPTYKTGSPYQCLSSFAGNALLVSPELLVRRGYLSAREIARPPRFSDSQVDFDAVTPYKFSLLRRAFRGFSPTSESRAFERRSHFWLDPFARFMALKSANPGRRWTQFDPKIEPSDAEVRFHKFVQFEFFRQWTALKAVCTKNGIAVLGDIPFYVEHDSADVWAQPQFFDLDARGEPRHVGGVPPDYFSKSGQLWGNPTYRWSAIEESGFTLWIERLRATLQLVDMARLDHFRGFDAFWQVPAGEKTARRGRWIKAPGRKMLAAAQRELGSLHIIAENLGVITPEVEALRREFSLPGMAVLQFAFSGLDSPHLPHNYDVDSIAFTGTHDNDTTCGWWGALRKGSPKERNERARAETYLLLHRVATRDVHWHFIGAVLRSVARFALIPMQDILGLGSSARMNVPGRARNNWRWRLRENAFDAKTIARLRQLTSVTGR